jgi:hypothetical protein
MSYVSVDLRKTYSADVLKPLTVMQRIMVKILNTKISASNSENSGELVDENKENREYYDNAPKRGTEPKSLSRELAARGNLW